MYVYIYIRADKETCVSLTTNYGDYSHGSIFFWYIHTFSWLEIIEASPLAVFFPTISSHYPLHGGRTPPTPTVAV